VQRENLYVIGLTLALFAGIAAQNTSLTVVHTFDVDRARSVDDDPLTKARLDLVNEALIEGARRLVRLAPPTPPT
jgi:hypothetical protein